MKTLHICSELYPLVKTGGLADVLGALPFAQQQSGMDVRVVLPMYPSVIEQVKNVCKSNEVQRAWARGQQLFVHGLIYSVHDGRLRDLNCSVDSNESLEEIYRFKH